MCLFISVVNIADVSSRGKNTDVTARGKGALGALFLILLTENDNGVWYAGINIKVVTMANYWMAVASANHVDRGVEGGFMQVCHGKPAALKRVKPHDFVVYYSSTYEMGGKKKCQCFTAVGVVKPEDIYQVTVSENFEPFRRDVDWDEVKYAPIRPILNILDFSAGNSNWGYQLRFGLIKISEHDFNVIKHEMTGKETAVLDLFG